MAAQRDYGTAAFSGLNTQTAEHLLNDSELTVADNVNFDELGAIKAEHGDVVLSGATFANPNGFGYAYFGDAGHYIYKDVVASTGYVKDYTAGAPVAVGSGAWQNADELFVTQGREECILTDGGIPRVWDGDVLRKLGPLVGTNVSIAGSTAVVRVDTVVGVAITNVAVAVGGAVTVTTGSAHSLTTGDSTLILAVEGATNINGRVYVVTRVDATSFTLDGIDGSDWPAYSGSAGTSHKEASGLTGDYSYKVSYTMELPDGTIIESSATDIPFEDGSLVRTFEPQESAQPSVPGFSVADVSGWISGSYTIGVDVKCGIRIYRNKSGGTDFFITSTGAHAQVYNAAFDMYYPKDVLQDVNLGAVWTADAYDDHDSPPDCSLFCISRGRAYCIDDDNPSHMHWSAIGNYDYWAPNDFWPLPENVTAMAAAGDYLAVMSENTLRIFDHSTDAGTWRDIKIQKGVSGQRALLALSGAVQFENQMGLGSVFFANDLGLWVAGPGGVQCVSDSVHNDWVAAGGGAWTGAVLGDRMIWACDNGLGASDKAFTIKLGSGGIQWGRTAQHSASYDYEIFVADPDSDVFIAQCPDGLFTFGGDEDSEKTMTVTSKLYFGAMPSTTLGFLLDLSGGASGSVTISSNIDDIADIVTSVSNGNSSRALVYNKVPLTTGESWKISYSGTGTLYGWRLVVAESDPYF